MKSEKRAGGGLRADSVVVLEEKKTGRRRARGRLEADRCAASEIEETDVGPFEEDDGLRERELAKAGLDCRNGGAMESQELGDVGLGQARVVSHAALPQVTTDDFVAGWL